MVSKIEVDEITNQSGDQDSGLDLSTNDEVKVNIANAQVMKVTGTQTDIKVSASRELNILKDSSDDFLVLKCTAPDASNNLRTIELVGETISFATGASSGTSSTERGRFDNSGRFLLGTTSHVIDSDQILNVSASQACNMQATVGSNDAGSVLNLKRSSNTQGDYIRLFNASGSETGQIRVDSGGTTQFENVSDYRLKENIQDWDVDASAKVKQIKIKTFDWKDQTAVTNGKGLVGVIAHELQEIYPHCVSGEKDGYGGDVDEDGNKKPMYQGVDYGKLTPLLTKALQEAIAKIESLEARITALEGK